MVVGASQLNFVRLVAFFPRDVFLFRVFFLSTTLGCLSALAAREGRAVLVWRGTG